MTDENLTVRAIRYESRSMSTDVVNGELRPVTTWTLTLYNGHTVTGSAYGDSDAADKAARAAAVAKILPVARIVRDAAEH